MRKKSKTKQSLFRRLLPWIITVLLLGALVIFVGIPLYATEEVEVENPPKVSYYEDGAKKLSMENDQLLFELDAQTTQFQLTEKGTGRVWYSNPPGAAKDTIAVAANKSTLSSTLIVTYSSSSGVVDFNNYQYSIENGSYTVEQLEDGAVKVNYSVGKIEKIYILPQATTVERFTEFTDKMDKKDQRKIKNSYTLYKPDTVAKSDRKDELLAMYPELETESLYVLKSDTSETNKRSMAATFEAIGYTEEDYEEDMQHVAGTSENNGAIFNVSVIYRLDGGDLTVEVPYSEIRYRAESPMTALTVLPMFGAQKDDQDGFMLIPEGGGALIRYNNGKLSQNSYYANMYGWDYGSERKTVVSETKNTFPMFGMTNQGGSFICMLEGAPSLAGVQADISGRYNNYNWACAKYTVLHSDRYNVSAKTARLVYMFEKELPDTSIFQRYRFIDSNSYVDMANAYGDYLRAEYPTLQTAVQETTSPVSVELVGAIDKKVVRFGLPVDAVIPATTFSQAEDILSSLSSIQNLSLRYSGWANGGISQKVLTRVKVLRQLGGESGLRQLIDKAEKAGVPLYLDGISCFAYRSGIFNGFIAYRDAARFTTREQIQIYPYSKIYYQQDDNEKPFYLVQPAYAQAGQDNLIAAVDSLGAQGVSFRDIGYLLSGDYDPKNTVGREEVRKANIQTVLSAKEKGEKVMIKEGYDYVMPYADLITDMDLNGIEYSIIDQLVPVYQIAIHGSVNYTGAPINICSDWETELLRCAEYGAGLNFTFMAEDARILQDTGYNDLYGSSFGAWSEHALQLMQDYQKDMEGLNNLRITDHARLSKDVAVTTYENGTSVFVNYGEEDYTQGAVTVAARSYLVTGGIEP
ncbi:MAG: hypothetical protein IJ083_04510 [Clostridia bacterium]|nr:hypothetical protein [Clostridia bacterium]